MTKDVIEENLHIKYIHKYDDGTMHVYIGSMLSQLNQYKQQV